MPWIGPEVPSKAITDGRRKVRKKSLGFNCRKKINKLLVKLFKLVLRTAYQAHAHTQALYLLDAST